ncbi:MAG: hypothetical protein G3M78_06800 [Candidatus Nitrohelix vancouverensis]|uniref:Zinc finger/thioredoxin putative domain-containing protein n=1 Tax=Candidatus Nitrohelix vancouverensis TaxID=2705534 RepID=A0A7T0C221_9BACT|nr:MAG: hypothetical protein G3M78_06800 [Candidatus Nitrohelix vancouverensis]
MQITCNECQKNINIPDEKLPKGQAFNITCPGCKAKVRVDQHLKAKAEPAEEPVSAAKMAVLDDFADEEELVIYDEGDELALIMDDKNKDVWTQTLQEKDYKLQYAKSPEQGVYKMKFTKFHLVALHEKFGGVSLDESAIYQSIIELPMELRRNIFVALVGKDFKTLSDMQAYQYSVNVVVNEKDLGKLGDILKKSIGEFEMMYKVYKETLKSLGKV